MDRDKMKREVEEANKILIDKKKGRDGQGIQGKDMARDKMKTDWVQQIRIEKKEEMDRGIHWSKVKPCQWQDEEGGGGGHIVFCFLS